MIWAHAFRGRRVCSFTHFEYKYELSKPAVVSAMIACKEAYEVAGGPFLPASATSNQVRDPSMKIVLYHRSWLSYYD